MFCSKLLNDSRNLISLAFASPSRKALMPSVSEPDSSALTNSRKSLVSLPIRKGTVGSMISPPRISADPRPSRSDRKVRRFTFSTCTGGAPDCCINPVRSWDNSASSSEPARTCAIFRESSERSFLAARMAVAALDPSAKRLVNSSSREVSSSLTRAPGTVVLKASPPLFRTSR